MNHLPEPSCLRIKTFASQVGHMIAKYAKFKSQKYINIYTKKERGRNQTDSSVGVASCVSKVPNPNSQVI